MEIREAGNQDLRQLLELYTQLHNNEMPSFDEELENKWNDIISDRNHHVLIGVDNEQIITSCVIVIIPNLTHKQRPYALVENVITHVQYRKKGYAAQLLNYARDLAKKEHCYKIMLLTGSKIESTLRFYEGAGYNRNDKTAFIQWLE